jgi:hypothetical protein
MKRLFTAAMLLAMTTITANAQLIINELMQSNVECIFDNDTKEFPDSWVELYNPTDAPISLGEYKIGTKKDKEKKAWQLPSQDVPARGHVIIYCDKEGITGSLHTDFRLESGKGCVVYLFKNKVIVDSLPYIDGKPMVKMPAPDVAFGRKTDGANEWGYQLTPTPGNANTGQICNAKKILGAPEFSVPGQVISGNATINLELSLPEKAPAGTIIRYTMDGSEPKPTDTSDTSIEYDGPISIERTTVIRAKLFCEGWLSPMSTAQSYIFHPRTMTIPIISILTKRNYFFDDATIGLYPNNTGKYDKVDWRRPINIEMFKAPEDSSVINQLGETRIQGGKSRENDLKSMAIYANKRFDPDKKRFEYEFFPDQKPGIDQFKSFSLRNGGNDFTDLYFRDLIVQRTMGENTDLDWQAGHTAVLYINGEYMGMLNIRERSNEDNIYSNYNGLEDIDEIEISHEDVTGVDEFIEELKEGDMENYNAFKEFYSEKSHTLTEYENWMDVSEYLNFAIMNLFYGNNDWPGNNTVFWRPRTDTGRWRVIVKDVDFGLGLYGKSNNYNMIDLLYNPNNHPNDKWAFTEPATRLLKNMLEDPGILNLFIDKCCVFMGDFMNGTGTGEIIDKIQTEAMEEFVAHRDKYNPGSTDWWGNWVPADNRTDITNKFTAAKTWAQGRPDNFITHMKNKWNLGTAIPVTINKNMDDAEVPDNVLVNNIKLTKGVFDGKFFKNRNITLEGKPTDGSNIYVEKWEIKKTPNNGNVQTSYSTDATYTFKLDNTYKSLSINAIVKPQVCIGQREAVSYSSTMPLDFSQTDVKAFIVIESGNKFIKRQVNKVPANTGLIVEGLQETYKIPVAAANTAFDDVTGNMLVSTAYGPFTVPDDENVYYGLFYSIPQERVGFKLKEPGYTFPKGKSYLFLSQDHQAKEFAELFYDGIIDGIATGIQGVNNKWTDGQIYNLNGQRVDKNYNGVIIVNGKKVINNRK